jgi:hypothetical protein
MVQIVNFKDLSWSEREERHREGSLAFKNLFRGKEGDPNNFRLVLSRSDGDYNSPHHRHNFDQVRFCVRGSANIAPGKTLNEGDVGYFPEGTRYGPQKDIASERITLVLQCGGASGLGYMSSAQLRRGLEELEQRGTFAGGRFRFHGQAEAESRDSYEAIWEHVFARPMEYPPQRYDEAILMRAASFAWVAKPGRPGIAHKRLGAFTERNTRIELLRIDAGHTAVLGEPGAMVLAFMVSGKGHAAGSAYEDYSAFRVDAGEELALDAREVSELLVIVLPLVTQGQSAKRQDARAPATSMA